MDGRMDEGGEMGGDIASVLYDSSSSIYIDRSPNTFYRGCRAQTRALFPDKLFLLTNMSLAD